ncbi:MAG: IS66 family transposase [Fulvivirga sp.]
MQTKPVPDRETITISLQEYQGIKAELAELKRLIFGSKSERFVSVDSQQTTLFDSPSASASQDALTVEISYQRKVAQREKQQPVRALLPAHLPRQEEVIEPERLEEDMKKIGQEVTEILEHVPGKLYVRRIVRPKYVKDKQDGVYIGPLPSLPLAKSNAGPSLLAHILVSKFVDHLPYHRQIQIFKREGITLSSSTFNGWFHATSRLLEPLYQALVGQVQAQDYLQADESPIKVQDGHKKGATHMGYHWVYHAPKQKLAVFDYQPSRSGKGPQGFLKTFQGSLQTDGYTAYEQLGKKPGITLLACMAHARRYFEKALDNDKERAEHALKVIQLLYALEREAQEDDSIDLITLRRQKAEPILFAWKEWLGQQQGKVLPKSSIGKAINYTINLWPRLIRYTQQADYCIDNNGIENTIRPLAIGRKNYLFAGSHEAAQRAAMFYSFFACCKLHQVNPYEWLKQTLERIPDYQINKIAELLPHNYKHLP